MNFLWVITFGFAFLAMLRLSRKIEKQLLELNKGKDYTFKSLGDNTYLVSPCPPNYTVLENLSNVVWVACDGGKLLIKAETQQAVKDLIIALNSTYLYMLKPQDKVRINRLGRKALSHTIAAYGISEGVVEGLYDFIASVIFRTNNGNTYRMNIQRMYLDPDLSNTQRINASQAWTKLKLKKVESIGHEPYEYIPGRYPGVVVTCIVGWGNDTCDIEYYDDLESKRRFIRSYNSHY
ncbi:hypothetical protein VF04_04315 [Nostoc linckia z7]|uniref:Uncharacterized protein n=2 Tax=Nostoc linckia TaxID=92942 RepID=A0A9Q6ENE9_NOSLI|nr:hypothetical protein [Nostoc linckia]PHK42937.1 hypothetical protein VF12_01015 [Nostoc linckia z15]PHK48094.1 hypothetical protein VF13_01990 [Nostoc linckia z16]PHJ65014.1 hypothetical protein VF02_11800 [Nostoc linckia z1]PHJ70192.1 hypothetical protein VF05_11960 [Nostoc linckia z3]PHJ75093.1 hypothetical protein VF03_12120 [Nostoc linckia z2]